jgi:hypothetical protein
MQAEDPGKLVPCGAIWDLVTKAFPEEAAVRARQEAERLGGPKGDEREGEFGGSKYALFVHMFTRALTAFALILRTRAWSELSVGVERASRTNEWVYWIARLALQE